MKKIILSLSCILLSSFLFSQENNFLIIKFKENKKPNSSEVLKHQKFENSNLILLNKNNNIKKIQLTGNKKEEDTYFIELNTSKPIEELIELYKKTNLFEYVEQNFRGYGHGIQTIPNDEFFARQWSHVNDGSFSASDYGININLNPIVDADVDTDLAWDITQGDPNIIVAILDTGLKLDHPEFAGRIWTNTDESINFSDSDSNGYTDDLRGWDFVNNDSDPSDDNGHGTNVGGVAVASGNNNIGYAGVNWNSKIMVCKVLDNNNSGFYSWWADGIYYAVDNGASVINLSAGGVSDSQTLQFAINYAYNNNVAVVVSTGNENTGISFPAREPNAFAVGSSDPDNTRSNAFSGDTSSGSNFGPELDFIAPGNFTVGLSHTSNTNYSAFYSGTSQAAPLVTGLMSLLLSLDPTLTVDQMRLIIEQTSEDQVGDFEDTPGWDQFYGNGKINIFEAVNFVQNSLSVSTFESNNVERM